MFRTYMVYIHNAIGNKTNFQENAMSELRSELTLLNGRDVTSSVQCNVF